MHPRCPSVSPICDLWLHSHLVLLHPDGRLLCITYYLHYCASHDPSGKLRRWPGGGRGACRCCEKSAMNSASCRPACDTYTRYPHPHSHSRIQTSPVRCNPFWANMSFTGPARSKGKKKKEKRKKTRARHDTYINGRDENEPTFDCCLLEYPRGHTHLPTE